MKILFLTLITFVFCSKENIAQQIVFKDVNLLSALLSHDPSIDVNDDNNISIEEAKLVTKLNLANNSIGSALELKEFTSLVSLNIAYNQIDSLPFHSWPKLTYLILDQNNFTAVDFSNNSLLSYLSIKENNVHHLHLENNPKLDTLNCDHSHVHHMKLYNCHELSYLSCSHNMLDSLNLVNNAELTYLDAHDNAVKQVVGIEFLKSLAYLDLEDCDLHQLNLSKCIALRFAYLGSNSDLSEVCLNEMQFSLAENCMFDFCYSKDHTTNWSNNCDGVITFLNQTERVDQQLVYPNPSSGLVTFSSSLLRIVNSKGELVQPIGAGNTVDLSDYCNGVYFFYFKNGAVTKVCIAR